MMMTLKECPFCGTEPVFRQKEEEHFVFCNGCFTVGDACNSEKEAADKWNRRVKPWREITNVPKDGRVVDLWINGYRVTNCQWDETRKVWTEGWIDIEGTYQSFTVLWAPPTYWMPVPESPEEQGMEMNVS